MTDEEARQLLGRIRAYAGGWNWRSPQDREDFVSYAVEQILSGRRCKMEWIMVDWLRKNVGGRSDGPHFDERRRNAVSIACSKISSEDIGGETPNPTREIEFLESIDQVRGPDRAIILLRGICGFSEEDIGVLFGVSEARISQRMSRAQRTARFFRGWEHGADFPLSL